MDGLHGADVLGASFFGRGIGFDSKGTGRDTLEELDEVVESEGRVAGGRGADVTPLSQWLELTR